MRIRGTQDEFVFTLIRCSRNKTQRRTYTILGIDTQRINTIVAITCIGTQFVIYPRIAIGHTFALCIHAGA